MQLPLVTVPASVQTELGYWTEVPGSRNRKSLGEPVIRRAEGISQATSGGVARGAWRMYLNALPEAIKPDCEELTYRLLGAIRNITLATCLNLLAGVSGTVQSWLEY
jgi:hypothetical protein